MCRRHVSVQEATSGLRAVYVQATPRRVHAHGLIRTQRLLLQLQMRTFSWFHWCTSWELHGWEFQMLFSRKKHFLNYWGIYPVIYHSLVVPKLICSKVSERSTTKQCSGMSNFSLVPKLYILKGDPFGQNVYFLQEILWQFEAPFYTAYEAVTGVTVLYLSKWNDIDKLKFLSTIFLSGITHPKTAISSPRFCC